MNVLGSLLPLSAHSESAVFGALGSRLLWTSKMVRVGPLSFGNVQLSTCVYETLCCATEVDSRGTLTPRRINVRRGRCMILCRAELLTTLNRICSKECRSESRAESAVLLDKSSTTLRKQKTTHTARAYHQHVNTTARWRVL